MSCCEDPPVTDNAASTLIRTECLHQTMPRPGVFDRLDSADDTRRRNGRWENRRAAGQTGWWTHRWIRRTQQGHGRTYRQIDQKH